MAELAEYVQRQKEWSQRTFGTGLRTVGITRHIQKECDEILAAPRDREEWIDIVILGLDGYWRAGGDPEAVMEYLQHKQDKNFARKWPGHMPEEFPVEHIK